MSVAEDIVSEQLSQVHRERLVVIVLADEDDAARAVPRVHGGPVILHSQVRRLFDQDMLACVERLEREREMEPRRHRDDHRIDVRVFDCGGVIRVRAKAAVLPAEGIGLGAIAARVTAGDLAPQRPEMAAVDAGDEAAAEKCQM